MNKTISVRMMERVRARTQDSRYDDDDSTLDDVVESIEARSGLLAPGGIVALKAVLAKYAGGGNTTAAGVTTPTSDALAKRLAEFEHNAKVSRGYRDFWTVKNAEFTAR